MTLTSLCTGGRSALHHACWRGAIGNVRTLLDLGCDINSWSTGLYSYGKTPIFYAITRDRSNVVELLLEHGARTRILNNKGQSVLSLAASHLELATVSAVEAAEKAEGELDAAWVARLSQLREEERPIVRSGGWLDFRASHPDGETYGDLDPRFLTADELEAISAIGGVLGRLSVNPTTREGRRLKKLAPGTRQALRPRPAARTVVQPSSKWPSGPSPSEPSARRDLEEEIEAAVAPIESRLAATSLPSAYELAAAVDALVGALRAHKGAWLQTAALRLGRACADTDLLVAAANAPSEDTSCNDGGSGGGGVGSAAGSRGLRKRLLLKAAKAPSVAEAAAAAAKAAVAAEARSEQMEARARAAAVAEGRRAERTAGVSAVAALPPPTTWVCDADGLHQAASALACADRVGIDTEWALAPGSDRLGDAVLATVQLGTVDRHSGEERAFVIDALLRPDAQGCLCAGHEVGSDSAAAYTAALRLLLERVLLRPPEGAPTPVGFSFVADAKKLARWFIATAGEAQKTALEDEASMISRSDLEDEASMISSIRAMVVDVQVLAQRSGQGTYSHPPSLQAVCHHFLCEVMTKEAQCSDWSLRPLSDEQLSYAGLDASACLRILATMEDDWGEAAEVPLDSRLVS